MIRETGVRTMDKLIGFMIRRERLNRNYSQESLCKGICAVSYLSKIEQEATTRLGMKLPEKHQVVYLDVKKDDMTDKTADESAAVTEIYGVDVVRINEVMSANDSAWYTESGE